MMSFHLKPDSFLQKDDGYIRSGRYWKQSASFCLRKLKRFKIASCCWNEKRNYNELDENTSERYSVFSPDRINLLHFTKDFHGIYFWEYLAFCFSRASLCYKLVIIFCVTLWSFQKLQLALERCYAHTWCFTGKTSWCLQDPQTACWSHYSCWRQSLRKTQPSLTPHWDQSQPKQVTWMFHVLGTRILCMDSTISGWRIILLVDGFMAFGYRDFSDKKINMALCF